MSEWKLEEARQKQYTNLMGNAQQLEMTIGSSQYRLSKLVDMRKELDTTLKTWWDEVIKEMKLDDKRDYMITNDGLIKDVSKEVAARKIEPVAPIAPPKTVDELK
jgi:hypothetical protein